VIVFSQISFHASPVILLILWAIGLSMIALAGLIYLPLRLLAGLSIAIIALHNLLDSVSAERFGRTGLALGHPASAKCLRLPGNKLS